MSKLLLMRHAIYENRVSLDPRSSEDPDLSAPLTEEGRAQAIKMADILRLANLTPDLILTTHKRRSRETGSLIAARLETRETKPICRIDDEHFVHKLISNDANVERKQYPLVLFVGHETDIRSMSGRMGYPIHVVWYADCFVFDYDSVANRYRFVSHLYHDMPIPPASEIKSAPVVHKSPGKIWDFLSHLSPLTRPKRPKTTKKPPSNRFG